MRNAIELLEQEWDQLGHDPLAARRLGEVCRIAGEARSLAEVEHYVRKASAADADRVLLALVARATDGDALAARVLLQLLLPGTRTLARRWWALGDSDERAAAAVTAVYQRIRNYPLERRPGRVAANVLMDAARELRKAVPQRVLTLAADPHELIGSSGRRPWRDLPTPHPADELADILHEAVEEGIIAAEDAAVVARSRIHGHRLADIGVERDMSERTVYSHRQRAERALTTRYLAQRVGEPA